MDITKEATTELFNKKLIAVHFQNTPEESDNVDYLDINNYKASSAKRAIKIFKELNENGGYIWAEYFEKIRIGKVKPYSMC
jgi:hypothetical protein